MIPAAIRKISEAKVSNIEYVEIWGDGLSRREFMYASDFADFINFAVDNFDNLPQNMNVGLGEDFTILQYYEKIAQVLGYEGEFMFDTSKPSGMKQKLVDTSLLNSFGWSHQYTLEHGIAETYQFYRSKVN